MRRALGALLALGLAYCWAVIAALLAYPRFPNARWVRAVLALEAWVSDTFWGAVGWVEFWAR